MKTEDSDLDFKDRLNALQKTVQKLESGQLTLEESLSAYEEGVRQLKACQKILEAAELKVKEWSEPTSS